MNEWSIIAVRLQALLARTEAAYEHVTLVADGSDEQALAIGRLIWSIRCEVRDALEQACALRRRDEEAEAKAVSNVQ